MKMTRRKDNILTSSSSSDFKLDKLNCKLQMYTHIAIPRWEECRAKKIKRNFARLLKQDTLVALIIAGRRKERAGGYHAHGSIIHVSTETCAMMRIPAGSEREKWAEKEGYRGARDSNNLIPITRNRGLESTSWGRAGERRRRRRR